MKKTFRVKNYKGNIIESLNCFQKTHAEKKIIEAVEENDTLKITVEDEISVEEQSKKNWDEVYNYILQSKDALDVFKNIIEASEKADDFDVKNNIGGEPYAESSFKAGIRAQKKAVEMIEAAFQDILANAKSKNN